jgi:hypothetical protein
MPLGVPTAGHLRVARVVTATMAFGLAGGGCSSVPETHDEAASGAVGGALGAVGGAVGGAVVGGLAGAVYGLSCGPAAVVCVPVMGIAGVGVGAVGGAAYGAGAGGSAGVESTRRDRAANAPSLSNLDGTWTGTTSNPLSSCARGAYKITIKHESVKGVVEWMQTADKSVVRGYVMSGTTAILFIDSPDEKGPTSRLTVVLQNGRLQGRDSETCPGNSYFISLGRTDGTRQ